MDLLQLHWKNLVCFVQRYFIYSLPIVLIACASSPDQKTDEQQVSTQQSELSSGEFQEQEQIEALPLTPDLIYYILSAEIAGQRGEMGTAVDLYHQAATISESSSVAGRSAQVAIFTRDQQRVSRSLQRWIEVDPTDADVYILQAPFLMLQGDYDGVIEAIDTAMELAPSMAHDYLTRISDNLSELVKPEQALTILQQIQLYQNNDPEALFSYGRLAAFFKQYNTALPAIEATLKQQPNREDALILKAEILQRLNQGDKAMAILKKPASKESASDELLFSYAKILGENNKTAQARAIFEQLNTKLPDNEEILFALGLLALEEKDGAQAKLYFSQLITLGDRGKQASYFMGLAEELNNNTDKALIWFASVPADSHRFQAAQTQYVNLLADNDQLDKARLHLKLLRKEHPERAIQYYVFEASFLRERGQDQAAFDLYSDALAEHSENIELLYGRAMVAEPLNRLSILEQDLNTILAEEPNNAQALNALGYTLADRTNRYQEAFTLITKAVELKPNDPFYLDSLGWVHYRLGNLDEAVRNLKQAVVIQADPEFLAHLGEVLWQQGKHSEAKRIWQQGLQHDPDNKLLLNTMRRFGQ
jgi:tetratricopeptide (TPR) repeat protein